MSDLPTRDSGLKIEINLLGWKIQMKIDWSKLSIKQAALVLDIEESAALTELINASEDEIYQNLVRENRQFDINSLKDLYIRELDRPLKELWKVDVIDSFAPHFRKMKRAYDRFAQDQKITDWPAGADEDKWAGMMRSGQ